MYRCKYEGLYVPWCHKVTIYTAKYLRFCVKSEVIDICGMLQPANNSYTHKQMHFVSGSI